MLERVLEDHGVVRPFELRVAERSLHHRHAPTTPLFTGRRGRLQPGHVPPLPAENHGEVAAPSADVEQPPRFQATQGGEGPPPERPVVVPAEERHRQDVRDAPLR